MLKPISSDTSRAWVDVNLAALVSNARSFMAATGVPMLPIIKANAYGLGAVPVARALMAVQPWGYGVGTIEEAHQLHAAGIQIPLVIFSPLIPQRVQSFAAEGVRPSIGDLQSLKAWLVEAGDLPFHLEVDTGMGRSGFPWHDAQLRDAVGDLVRDAIGWEAVFTHFHSSDWNANSTREQWNRLQGWLGALGQHPPLIHASNSGGGRYGEVYAGDLTRPGLHIYGGRIEGLQAQPVASLRARVVALRQLRPGDTVSYDATWQAPVPTIAATLGIGYADGLPRSLSSKGKVEILGAIRPIIGRVTMDHIVVDVGDLPVELGEIATLFGGMITLEEQAALAGTLGYELLTGLGSRLPRRYGNNG